MFGALGLNEAFSLNSRPEATHTIFLDFDGHTVTGTSWNSTVATIEAGRYRRESASNPDNGFTQNELNGIVEIWQRVAEDFAAWDVNVTTEDPGVDALMRQGFDDDEYGIRTIITPDYEWYDTRRFGGVAYLRSFSRSSDLPAWVFSSNLGTGNPKSVAEAVSHEVGHTLGLQHDGIDDGSSSSSYYSGHGSWAPIMGVGYYRDVTQWSDGDYPGATNTEDDLYIIDGFIDRLPDSPAAGAAGAPERLVIDDVPRARRERRDHHPHTGGDRGPGHDPRRQARREREPAGRADGPRRRRTRSSPRPHPSTRHPGR